MAHTEHNLPLYTATFFSIRKWNLLALTATVYKKKTDAIIRFNSLAEITIYKVIPEVVNKAINLQKPSIFWLP